MADEDRIRLVEEFCKVTGIDSSRAQLYLEAAGWNSDLAMSSYYEETDEEAGNVAAEQPVASSRPVVAASSSSRFATLSNLIRNDDKDDEEEGQAFYAGGSERSGQQVLGPGKRKAGPEIVEEMFKAARSHGAQVVEPSETNRGTTQLKAFRGTGYKLGCTNDDTEVVASAVPVLNEHPVDICLRVWRTGFTVDQGPLREYTDPENKDFLDSIRRGEIPPELIHRAKGGEVNLNIEDHSHEEYTQPKISHQAFAGAGYRLGSPTPPVAGTNSPAECQKNETDAQQVLKVDESQPVTSIQLRLADGSRLIVKLNYEHTVGDIRRYLVTARPEYSASVFSLMIAYPSKELVDDNASVKNENLLNAVIIQKLK